MLSEVIGGTTNTAPKAYCNEDQAIKAYSYVFELIAEQEGKGGGGVGWMPTKTGLHLCLAPPEKGRSRWVSEEGKDEFLKNGEDAIQ